MSTRSLAKTERNTRIWDLHAQGLSTRKIAARLPLEGYEAVSHVRVAQVLKQERPNPDREGTSVESPGPSDAPTVRSTHLPVQGPRVTEPSPEARRTDIHSPRASALRIRLDSIDYVDLFRSTAVVVAGGFAAVLAVSMT